MGKVRIDGNGKQPKTAAELREAIGDVGKRRQEAREAIVQAEKSLGIAMRQVFDGTPGAAERQRAHKQTIAEANDEITMLDFVSEQLGAELAAVEKADAEALAKQRAAAAVEQAMVLERSFNDLDLAVKTTMAAFTAAEAELGKARDSKFLNVTQIQCRGLLTDAFLTALGTLNLDPHKIRILAPGQRHTFTELGQRYADATRGLAQRTLDPGAVTSSMSSVAPVPAAPASSPVSPAEIADLASQHKGTPGRGVTNDPEAFARLQARKEAALRGIAPLKEKDVGIDQVRDPPPFPL